MSLQQRIMLDLRQAPKSLRQFHFKKSEISPRLKPDLRRRQHAMAYPFVSNPSPLPSILPLPSINHIKAATLTCPCGFLPSTSSSYQHPQLTPRSWSICLFRATSQSSCSRKASTSPMCSSALRTASNPKWRGPKTVSSQATAASLSSNVSGIRCGWKTNWSRSARMIHTSFRQQRICTLRS